MPMTGVIMLGGREKEEEREREEEGKRGKVSQIWCNPFAHERIKLHLSVLKEKSVLSLQKLIHSVKLLHASLDTERILSSSSFPSPSLLPFFSPCSLYFSFSSGDGISLSWLSDLHRPFEASCLICLSPSFSTFHFISSLSFSLLTLTNFLLFSLSTRRFFITKRASKDARRNKCKSTLSSLGHKWRVYKWTAKKKGCYRGKSEKDDEKKRQGEREREREKRKTDPMEKMNKAKKQVYFYFSSLTRQRVVESKSLLSQSSQVTKDALNYDFSFSFSLSFQFQHSLQFERSNWKVKEHKRRENPKAEEKQRGRGKKSHKRWTRKFDLLSLQSKWFNLPRARFHFSLFLSPSPSSTGAVKIGYLCSWICFNCAF